MTISSKAGYQDAIDYESKARDKKKATDSYGVRLRSNMSADQYHDGYTNYLGQAGFSDPYKQANKHRSLFRTNSENSED